VKLKLKATGTKCLKLKHDEPLSSSGFNFNLRRYIVVTRGAVTRDVYLTSGFWVDATVRPCRFCSSRHRMSFLVFTMVIFVGHSCIFWHACLLGPGGRRLRILIGPQELSFGGSHESQLLPALSGLTNCLRMPFISKEQGFRMRVVNVAGDV
jgi:hypothetical protein